MTSKQNNRKENNCNFNYNDREHRASVRVSLDDIYSGVLDIRERLITVESQINKVESGDLHTKKDVAVEKLLRKFESEITAHSMQIRYIWGVVLLLLAAVVGTYF